MSADYITVDEACSELQVSPDELGLLVSYGGLRTFRSVQGETMLFSWRDVERMRDGHPMGLPVIFQDTEEDGETEPVVLGTKMTVLGVGAVIVLFLVIIALPLGAIYAIVHLLK